MPDKLIKMTEKLIIIKYYLAVLKNIWAINYNYK